jgi:hypothetical protein
MNDQQITPPQRPERVRIVGPGDRDEIIIEIPPLPAEPDRIEFDHSSFANDDEATQ